MDVPSMIYADPALIDTIVGELKSQGTFDQFRKECINDVDTKPAYQNLHQRVESTVSNYLEGKTWRPDLNKNQLRDSLRKHILEMGFLETGVERIVDQVVNPKVHTVFMPQVEDVVYRVQGIPKPEKKTITNSSSTIGSASKNGGVFNQPPSFLPGLSFLPPALQNHIQKAPTLEDLLPTDLDPVSPESSKDSADEALEESGIIKQHDDSMESQLSGISDLTSHGSDHVAVESENKNDELNEDSHQSKMPCLNKMKSIETEEHFTERDASMSHDEAEQALEETQENLYPSGSVVQYGDQFSMEEEVATTVHNVNTEAPSDANVKNTNFFETGETLNPEKTELEGEENNIDSECAKYPHSCELSSAVVDDNSLAQSDDSQFSGSSDNKLLIDEMKDYNSQSGNSHQPEDERSSMKTSSEGFLSEENSKIMVVENIVEASEEARHGFEDSQDALEKPPLPQTLPVVRDHEDRPPLPPDSGPEVLQRPPLPLTPPLASQHEAILPPLPPPPPPPPSEAMKSTTPPPPKTPPLPQGFGCTGLEPMSTSSTSVIATHETERMNDRTFSPRSTTPTGKYPGIEHPSTPPGAPPVVNRSVERPPLPSTPPLANRPKEQDRPPLPPLPPPADILGVTERPPLPPMPPLAEKANLERPPTPQPTTLNRTPPPLPEEEFSRDSNASLSYEEGAVPKTPRWEPRSPETEKEKPALSDLEQIGIPNPTKMRQSFITSPKNSINCQDEDSQSGSEEMQLAWSPLSNHGDEGNDENGGKRPSEEKLSVEEAPLEDPSPQVKSKEDKGSSSERSRESKKDDELKSESEKHREKDNAKDGRSKERRKEDENDRSRKDSSSSSKRHDDRSSKHRESSSRSKHDDKSRSDKDRDRHSSHHRSDERRRDDRRDDKERSSSSRHKSSRSDDRHRHRDKDQRHGSSSRHEHHDKSSKSEDRSKSSKSHSSDRKDSDRKERESRDKERRMDKEKERSRKDSSRTDEKKRDKERDKDKRDKSSNICRPNNDRKSPDPDVNNGSTFGGNNHGATGSGGGDDHHHDTSNQDSNKGSGSTNTNSKSSDSSQQNNLCSDPPSTSSACNQACPLSSLPLKKRPLLPESEALHEFPCGQQLVLKIKKLKKCDDKPENTKRRKIKALRRLEKEAIRNLTKCPNSSHLVDSGDETSEPLDVSPTKYFESFWPTKSDDKAFLAYVEDLEQSKTLSGLSDLSGSDSEDEEILHSDDSKNPHSGVIGRDIIFSLSLLPDAQALKFPDPNCYDRRQDTKERASKSSNSVKATKRTKQRKPLDSESDTKRHKVLAKEVETPAPTELKSRRARKPNKRYSNDEFTSHFDNEDELDMIEEESVLVPGSSSPQPKESSTSITSASTTSWKDNEKIESVSLPEIDHQKEENKLNIDASRLCTVASKEKPHQSEQVTYSWNKDSYNSNSEDEMDSANTESDLIGTALKNLMMESGLGGPDEASGSQKVPSPPRKTLTNSLSGINTKTIPLSGVKRVGLSRNYKGNKKSSVKPSVAAVSCGQFSLPPSPESDVSASSYEKGAARKLQGSQSDAPELDSNAESNRTGTSRVKQHYSSDDLYKPRPPLRLTSKRSKAVSEQNGSH